MDVWATFWGLLLAVVLVVYACLAVVITIGAFSDVKRMLTTMDDRHKSQPHTEGKDSDGVSSD